MSVHMCGTPKYFLFHADVTPHVGMLLRERFTGKDARWRVMFVHYSTAFMEPAYHVLRDVGQ